MTNCSHITIKDCSCEYVKLYEPAQKSILCSNAHEIMEMHAVWFRTDQL